MAEEKTCCICGRKFVGWGNNPWGAEVYDPNNKLIEFGDDDECCDDCNINYVLPGRLKKMYGGKQ